jgi:hypothetical protein
MFESAHLLNRTFMTPELLIGIPAMIERGESTSQLHPYVSLPDGTSLLRHSDWNFKKKEPRQSCQKRFRVESVCQTKCEDIHLNKKVISLNSSTLFSKTEV